jgi:hypothetical protein
MLNKALVFRTAVQTLKGRFELSCCLTVSEGLKTFFSTFCFLEIVAAVPDQKGD